jgi:thymidylate synthase (FAD)
VKIIEPSYEILTPIDGKAMLQLLELSGRVCYKSEDKITDDSHIGFVDKICNAYQHESVIEHCSVTVKFIHNRGFTHELVRHRLSSFSQESTRYANYSKDKFDNQITVIRPYWMDGEINEDKMKSYLLWEKSMKVSEEVYLKILEHKLQPQAARGVLPNDLKTEIVCTSNLRQWKNIFKLRTAQAAHPDMKRTMIPLLNEFKAKIPVIFDKVNA